MKSFCPINGNWLATSNRTASNSGYRSPFGWCGPTNEKPAWRGSRAHKNAVVTKIRTKTKRSKYLSFQVFSIFVKRKN